MSSYLMDFCTQDRSKDWPVVEKMQKKYWKLKQLALKATGGHKPLTCVILSLKVCG
uniref:Uncharacterized protein n=1 Tax=Falco tinnunculus TaxID=100819 RepID=A0A8C4TTJ1_FALTI